VKAESGNPGSVEKINEDGPRKMAGFSRSEGELIEVSALEK